MVGRPREGSYRNLAPSGAGTYFSSGRTSVRSWTSSIPHSSLGTKHEQGSGHCVRIAVDRSDPWSTDALPYVWLRRLSCTHGTQHRGKVKQQWVADGDWNKD